MIQEYFRFLKDKDSPAIRTLKKQHDWASWCLDCLCKEGSLGSIPFDIEYIEKIYVRYWLEALIPNFYGLFQFVPLFSFTLQFDFPCKRMGMGK